jgi:hypothetical protein
MIDGASLLFLLLAGANFALASSNCSTIDLSGGIGSNWNQIDTSWCHAFTATDCLTKHLQNKGFLAQGERLHPLQIAAAKPLANGRSVVKSTDIGGTMIGDMLALSEASYMPDEGTPHVRVNDGLCKEADLASEKNRAQALFNEDWRFAIRMFGDQGCDSGAAVQCSHGPQPILAAQPLCSELIKKEGSYWTRLFKDKCKMPWPNWHARYYFNPSRFAQMNSGKRLESPAPDKKMKEQIDKALESNELAAIGYDVSFVRKVRTKRPESHWTAVVGRHRGPGGQCIYVLKNSWGSDCGYYNSSIKCKGGTLEIPAEQLLPRVHTVQYFDD